MADASISLTRGRVALVSPEDAAWAALLRWRAQPSGRTWYAMRDVGGTTVSLHRAVAARAGLAIDGKQVDHINGDGLDCRRGNLRVTTGTQNQVNYCHKARGCSSQYKMAALEPPSAILPDVAGPTAVPF